ncbi:MAG: hypothetical protein J5714_01415 [Alphaproteobacteria bacterium]|nr:hypothetical protein [Alphaproteobacteria bacterium]
MDKTIEKLIAMAAGQNRDCFDENSISSDVRGKIDDALDSVFRGKSILIWTNGGKLGDAWESAMQELLEQIFEIKNTTPIVEYLRIAVFELRKKWEIKKLQSNERNSVANVSGQELTNLRDYANSLIESGMCVINGFLNSASTTGAQREPQKIMVMNMERTRSNEYERIHKR